MQVLILEDDPALRFALTQIVQDAGDVAYAAGDIPTACRLLCRTKPDVLLLDLMIGSLHSIQVADLAAYRVPDAKIIYLTGSNKFPNGELFEFSTNASLVLRKPIDFRALKDMLAHLRTSSATSLAS